MHSLSMAQSILQAALEEARKHDGQYKPGIIIGGTKWLATGATGP